jgi:hypothetical protein
MTRCAFVLPISARPWNNELLATDGTNCPCHAPQPADSERRDAT